MELSIVSADHSGLQAKATGDPRLWQKRVSAPVPWTHFTVCLLLLYCDSSDSLCPSTLSVVGNGLWCLFVFLGTWNGLGLTEGPASIAKASPDAY